jgi:uncharacterized protein with HEPN domain
MKLTVTFWYTLKTLTTINQIIHAYDNISDENIWAIISKHIPLLKEEITILINTAE